MSLQYHVKLYHDKMETTLNQPAAPAKRIASDGVIGMIFLLATEGMFFAGLISAFVVHRASEKVWPPVGQPRLPVEVTAVNTLVLLASAFTIFLFGRMLKNAAGKASLKKILLLTILLGGTFVVVQGSEWVRLLQFGLTTSSSLYGSFFYLLVGAHAVHVVAGLLILLYLLRKTVTEKSTEVLRNKATVCSMYWYFVVLVWPVLYLLVYFN